MRPATFPPQTVCRLSRWACALAFALWSTPGSVWAQGNNPDIFDIGTGGTATITGAVGGSVTVSPSPLVLQVTVNFGELSPINTNGVVRVSIPVTVRSEAEYRLVATVVSSNMGTSPDAVQLSDIGVGFVNMRALSRGEVCPSPHTIYPPFNSDPATAIQRTPRATYPGALAQLTGATIVMSGPVLSSKNIKLNPNQIPGNQRENGWAFDLVLVAAPQFFAPGSSTATLTLSISRGPSAPCP